MTWTLNDFMRLISRKQLIAKSRLVYNDIPEVTQMLECNDECLQITDVGVL